ncbi:ATP-dependent helicase [bacterium]|nr:ATP-dependent helicase [bacterium]
MAVIEIKPNEQQQKCIEKVQGPVVALAGPGTGKTFTLVERIDYMVNHLGISPERILCMSFSNTASDIMVKKISEKIGDEKASKMTITNYHSFCNEIRNEFPDRFSSNKKTIGSVTQKMLIKRAFEEVNPEFLKIGDAIETCIKQTKLERLTPEKYLERWNKQRSEILKFKISLDEIIEAHEKKIAEVNNAPAGGKKDLISQRSALKAQREDYQKTYDKFVQKEKQGKSFLEVYKRYIELMDEEGYIDFEDMINSVIDEFEKDKQFLAEIAGRYDYYFVDEYQDTNNVQNTLIFLLVDSTEEKNIFVVGDDDQLLFRFQGAKKDTFKKFISKYSPEVIPLYENMRSSQPVLDLANIEIDKDDFRLIHDKDFSSKYSISKKLKSMNETYKDVKDKVVLTQYKDGEQERNAVISKILDIVNSKEIKDKNGEVRYNEIAIISKSNSECDEYAKILARKGIPYEYRYGKDIFKVKSSLVLYFYLLFVVDALQNFDKMLMLMINPPFNFSMSDYEYFLYYKNDLKKCFSEYLSGGNLVQIVKEKFKDNWDKFQNKEVIEKFFGNYAKIKRTISDKTDLAEIVLTIANYSGIIDYYIKDNPDKLENILVIKQIIKEAGELFEEKPESTLGDFAYYLNFASKLNDSESIKTPVSEASLNAVQLVTVHSSKGNEYEHVFLPKLTPSSWESNHFPYDDSFIPKDEIILESEYKDLKYSEQAKYLFVALTRAKRYLYLSCTTTKKGEADLTNLLDFVNNDKNAPEESRVFEHYDFSNPGNNENAEVAVQNEVNALTMVSYDEAESIYKKEFDDYLNRKIEGIEFSVSQMNKYITCPKNYMFGYIWGLWVNSSSLNNMDSASYGNAVHYACQKLAEKTAEQKEPKAFPSCGEFLSDFEYSVTKEEKFSSSLVMENMLENGKRDLPSFYSKFTKKFEPSNIVSAELPFEIYINPKTSEVFEEKELREDDKKNYICVTGKIDLVVKNNDGSNTYTIYDYKTGNRKKPSDIKKGASHEDYFNQLRIYKLAFEKLSGFKSEVTKVAIICPDVDDEDELCVCNVTPNLSPDSNKEIISDFLAVYEQIRKKEFKTDYALKNRTSFFCQKYCPYQMYCKNKFDEAIYS